VRRPPPIRHIMINSPKNGFWSGRSVLVTGATGLLGGWLVKQLVEAGADVTALIRDGAPKSMLLRDGWINRINTVNGGLHDTALLRRAMSEYSVDTVFHLAAQTIVGVAKVDPVTTLKANVQGTWNVLEAARQTHVKQTVVASSDKAYGASDQLPYREDNPLRGRYPYDVSKSCADLVTTMYAATYGLPVVIARCANLFGGGDLNFSRTIPGVILAALHGQRFLIRSDGKFVRDFLYVRDAATAYMRLAEKLAADRGLAGEAFNFGLEIRLTVLELVKNVLTMMHCEHLEPTVQNIASSEIREQYLSAEKARRMLDWQPAYTLDAGLQETIDWYREFLGVTLAKPESVLQAAATGWSIEKES
jgi:CDP-glucose 4,6-dehydratase